MSDLVDRIKADPYNAGLALLAADEIARLRARPTEEEVVRVLCGTTELRQGNYFIAARAVLALFPDVGRAKLMGYAKEVEAFAKWLELRTKAAGLSRRPAQKHTYSGNFGFSMPPSKELTSSVDPCQLPSRQGRQARKTWRRRFEKYGRTNLTI